MPGPLCKVQFIFNISTKCQETGEFLSFKKNPVSSSLGGKIEMRPGVNYIPFSLELSGTLRSYPDCTFYLYMQKVPPIKKWLFFGVLFLPSFLSFLFMAFIEV